MANIARIIHVAVDLADNTPLAWGLTYAQALTKAEAGLARMGREYDDPEAFENVTLGVVTVAGDTRAVVAMLKALGLDPVGLSD